MARFKGRVGQLGQIRIDSSKVQDFKAIAEEAFADVVAALDVEFPNVIEDPNEFADKGFVDHDIVDTGRFRDSQAVDVVANKVTWIWAPVDPDTGDHYAAQLYSGFSYGGRYIPGRHWPERTLQRIDPVRSLQASLRARGINARVISNNVNLLDA